MQIRVTMNCKANAEVNSILDLVVRPNETVASVKEKVAGSQLVPFPEQELKLAGVVLADDSQLSACGVQEGSSLLFEVKATDASLAQQLCDLLQTRDLSADELGLLYCYKHGASIKQALLFIGFGGKLQDFIGTQKSLSMENGSVKVVKGDTSLKPFSVLDEVVQILKADESGSMEVKTVCAKFVGKFGVNLASIVGGRPVEFFLKEKGTFVVRSGVVSLHGAKRKKKEAAVPAPASPPGLGAGPPGLSAEPSNDEVDLPSIDCQQFLELHSKIHSRPFNSKITQSLNDLVGALSDASFLDIDHVVTGGSIGKGTAISGVATAEVVLFLGGLPTTGQETWYAPLLKAVAGSMSEDFQATHGIESIQILDDCVKIHMQGPSPIVVDLYLSPTFEKYQDALQLLDEQEPNMRKFYHASLVKERTQFVARQPSSVKITIRLMKWWRDQQEWYGRLSRPSDELLEYATIYSAVQTKPADQKEAIANVMSLLSRFNQIRVVWSNYYSKDDIHGYMLRQKPLLMDPTNPFVNVADPKAFDASELMVLARTTHFFW